MASLPAEIVAPTSISISELHHLRSCVSHLRQRREQLVQHREQQRWLAVAQDQLAEGCDPTAWGVCQPLFGRLRIDGFDIESLVGAPRVPPIIRPTELTLVASEITTFDELSCALRHCLHCCTLHGSERLHSQHSRNRSR